VLFEQRRNSRALSQILGDGGVETAVAIAPCGNCCAVEGDGAGWERHRPPGIHLIKGHWIIVKSLGRTEIAPLELSNQIFIVLSAIEM
jgi:hypothetical protein